MIKKIYKKKNDNNDYCPKYNIQVFHVNGRLVRTFTYNEQVVLSYEKKFMRHFNSSIY